MKRVLIHNSYFPEGQGGAEQVVRNRAVQFAKHGDAVHILVPGHTRQVSTENGVTIIRFSPRTLFLYKDATRFPWIVRLLWHTLDIITTAPYRSIEKELTRLGADIVEIHNTKGIGQRTIRQIQKSGIPTTLYLHDVQLVVPSGILRADKEQLQAMRFLQSIYARLVRTILGSPDEVISPSTWLLDFYTNRGFFTQSKKNVLPFGADKYNEQQLEKRLKALREKIEKKESLHFVYIGKLEEYKGILFLTAVWKALPQTHDLTIFGSGSAEQQVQAISKNDFRIMLRGYQDQQVIARTLQKADALIMPSLCHENRPEVIMESLRQGIPVIASEAGGIPEIVRDGKTGYLFKPGDKNSLLSILQ